MSSHSVSIYKIKQNITSAHMLDLAFVLYLCFDFATVILERLSVPVKFSQAIVLILIYGLLAIVIFTSHKKFAIDFFVLYFFILLLFFYAYVAHPDWRYWYTRPSYGFWDYALKPNNGIYAYLFVRMISDPDKIIKDIKIAGWIMYLFYGRLFVNALSRGYWLTTNRFGEQVRSSYSLSFGYSVLLFTMVMLYEALKKHKKSDIIGAAIGIVMIVSGGSRGPILCIVIFFGLMAVDAFIKSHNKVLIFLIAILAAAVVLMMYNDLSRIILDQLSGLSGMSRTIDKLLEGTIVDDSGRDRIWAAAWEMIKAEPFTGYGVMGARHVISYYHVAGHCHNIALEMFVDYGLIVGILLIAIMIRYTVKMLIVPKYSKWKYLFIVLFSVSCELLLSACYWNIPAFWAGIAVCYTAVTEAASSKKSEGVQNVRVKN